MGRLLSWVRQVGGSTDTAGRRRPRPVVAASRWMEPLEQRILLSGADPAVTLAVSDPEPKIGETVTLDLELTNNSATDTGFTPFVDLILDTTGADGSPNPDGLTFNDSSFLGGSLQNTELTFDATGQVIHPITGEIITAAPGFGPGDTMVVFQFPLGSFAPGQSVDFTVDLDISNLADVGTPLGIAVQGGFALGCDPLDNPGADPPIRGGLTTGSVSPLLFTTEKTIITSEEETATGPNFPYTYEVTIDIADGQTLDNLNFQDFIPDHHVYLGGLSVSGSAGATNADISGLTEPTIGTVPFNPPASELSFDLGSVTGTLAGDDIVIRYDAYVNDLDANGNPVLPSGNDSSSTNTATVGADWTPIDGRDPTLLGLAQSDDATIQEEAIVIRKGVSVLSDPDGLGLSAGDTLQYTMTVSLSDYFTAGDIIVTDSLGDGQSFDASFIPTFVISERGGPSTAGAFDQIDTGLPNQELTTTPNDPAGVETLTFDLSQAMVNQGLDDLLVGGLVNGGLFGGTTATITFQAVVDSSYVGPVVGDPSVSQGDSLGNSVVVDATLRDNVAPGAVISAQTDDSGSGLAIATGAFSKDLYAINGVIGAPGTNIEVGDTITYLLSYTLPLTEFENFVIDDFLPQPILDLGLEPVSFVVGASDPPPAGVATFGPGDTFFGITGITPATSALVGNILRFDMGDFDPPGPQASTIEILLTMTVQDAQFADGLFLSNQATATEANTGATTTTEDSIVLVELASPVLDIGKGVVSALENSPNLPPGLAFDSAVAPAGVTFQAPGIAAGPAFTGTISSASLSGTLDANVSGLDAGDLVKFAIVAENTGDDDAFDVRIDDTIPAGMIAPGVGTDGINLKVTDGAGNALAFTSVTTASGIEVTLVDGPTGSLQDAITGASTPGSNLAIISYDLLVDVDPAASAGETLTNTATVEAFAAIEGGMNRSDQPSNDAAVTLSDPTLAKTVVATSQPGTGTGQGAATLADLTIGETVTFELVAIVPEGQHDIFTIQDALPAGLQPLTATVTAVGSDVVLAGALGLGSAGSIVGQDVTFDFTDAGVSPLVVTPDGDTDASDAISVQITALVTDVPGNAGITALTNTGEIVFDGGTVQASQQIEIVEPLLQIDKSSPTTTGDAGDTVSYTITITHDAASSAPAYDLEVLDPLLAGVTIVTGTLNATSSDGASLITVNSGTVAGETLDIDVSELGLGETLTVTFNATLDPTVRPADVLTNTADVNWDSLPGADPNARPGNADDPHTVTVPVGALDKTIVSTSRTDTGTEAGLDFHDAGVEDLAIGELVTYQLVYTMPESAGAISIVDDLPDALTVMSSAVVSIGGNITGSALAVGAPGIANDANFADGLPDQVVFDFGNLTNAADGVVDADDQIVVQVTALVENTDPTNVDGQQKTNTGTVRFTNGTIQDTADVNVVEPSLDIQKSVTPATGDAGDSVSYTIVVSHEAGSTLNAYDLTVVDSLLADLTLTGGTLNVVSTDAGSVVTVNSGNLAGETIDLDVSQLALGETLTITFDATLDNTVPPSTDLINTADLGYDNAPGVEVNERAETDADNATVTTGDPALDKSVFTTSVTQTGSGQVVAVNPDLVMGETVTYELVFVVPEGTTGSLVITDDLPTVNGVLELQSATVTAFGANLSSSNGLALGSTATSTGDVNLVDGITDQAAFDFGQVTNLADNTADAGDEIRIQVTALVVDVPANATGDTLTNTATADFATGIATATADVDLVEPALVITKDATPTTVADAGDPVTYTLTVTHAPGSTATAFDLAITDPLAAELVLQGGTLTATSTDAASVFTVNAGSTTGDTLDVSVSELALGETITITFVAVPGDNVEIDQILPNTATLDWDSNPGAGGRPGMDDDPASVTVNAQPTLDKSIVTTSRVDTGTGQFTALEDLAIGETVTFQLQAVIPEGTIDSLILTDNLPTTNGVLSVVSATVVGFGPNLSSSNGLGVGSGATIGDVNLVDGITDQAVFDFGTVVNTGNNDPSDDVITVQIVALVEDAPVNIAGDILTNTGILDFTTSGPPGQLTDTEQVELVEPALVITKDATPTTVADAGDPVTYTLTVTHAPGSTATAFDLAITDPLAAELVLQGGTLTATSTDAASVFTVNAGSTTGDTLDVSVSELALGETITITFVAVPGDNVEIDQILPNTATLDWDSNPGAGGRPGMDDDPASVTVNAQPTLDKSIVTTSRVDMGTGQFTALEDLAIGETVTFQLQAVIPEGTIDSLILTDNLPTTNGVLSVVSATVVGFGPNLSSSNGLGVGSGATIGDVNLVDGITDQAVFDFGTVVNTGNNDPSDDVITVQIVALVEDAPVNVTGDILTNTGILDFTTSGPPGQLTDTEQIELVEPALVLDKAASTTDLAPGETYTYTLTVSHDPSSTLNAYDLQLTDLISDPLITLVPGSVVFSGGSGMVVNSGNGAGDATLDVTIGQLDLGQTATVTYTVQVSPTAPVATTINNTADLAFDNTPGVDPNERGDAETDSEIVRTQPGLDKAIFATDLGDTALQVGETIAYDLTITIGEGDSNLVLTDDLPDVFRVLSAEVIAVGGNLSGIALGQLGVQSDANFADGLPDRAIFDFGTVTNIFDGAVGADDQVVVRVTAIVEDVSENVDGNTDTNTATLDFGDPNVPTSTGTITDVEDSTIVEPVLQIDKASSSNAGDAGDVLTFTLTIDHTALSTGEAYDVSIADLISDPNLALVPGTVSILGAPPAGATVALGNGATDTTLQVTAPSLLQGETLVIQYQAEVLINAEPLDLVVNQADLTWDSFPGVGGRPGTDADGETFVVDGPTLDKVLAGSSDKDTKGDKLFLGEKVFFEITISIPEGTNPTIVITDFLPARPGAPGTLRLLSAEVVFIGANLSGSALALGDPGTPADTNGDGRIDSVIFDFTSGGPVVNNPDGTPTIDDQITVRVEAVVPDGLGNRPGDLLTNRAEFDFGSGVLTDLQSVRLVDFPPVPPVPPVVTASPPSLLDLYAYNEFENFLGLDQFPSAFGRAEEREEPELPPLSIDPMYSGTAEPGAALVVKVRDAQGSVIGTRTVVADAGGNWVAKFGSSDLEQIDLEREQGHLRDARLFGREGGFEGRERDIFGFRRDRPGSSQGTVLRVQPHTLEVTQTRPSYNASDEAGQNRRTYFAPAINDPHFVLRPVSVERVMEERASASVELLQQGTARPFALGWNKFDEEFLGEPGQPSGR